MNSKNHYKSTETLKCNYLDVETFTQLVGSRKTNRRVYHMPKSERARLGIVEKRQNRGRRETD